MPKIAAIIPHWNRRDLLLELLANLAQQTRPFDEIIVVDNGSTDDSVAVALANGAQVIKLEKNLGFAAAVNRGIQASHTSAQGDWIAILNNDVTLAPDWLETLLAATVTADFAAGKILRASDHRVIDGTFDLVSGGGCAYRCGAGRPDGPLWNQPRNISIAPMTAAIFRRSLFDEVGLLDERFQSYLEDVDFGLRCARGSGLYVPSAVAYHRGSSTLGTWNKDTAFLIARNQVFLAAKHFAGQPRWPIVVGQLLWGLVALRHGCGWAYVKGKVAGLHGWRDISAGNAVCGGYTIVQEKEIRNLARQLSDAGGQIETYWRLYFWLSRR